jgi:ribonuclease E
LNRPEAEVAEALLPSGTVEMMENGAPVTADTTEGGDVTKRRRRRGGRGRSRGEGVGDTAPGNDDAMLESAEPADESMAADEPSSASQAPALPMAAVPQPLPVADQPIVVPVAPAPSPALAPAPASAPSAPVTLRAEPYTLPIEQLSEVAQSAGLEWVHSDGDKVRAAQAAMAAETTSPRVPREPKPPVAIDDGPLVLVETKKDLSQVRLPFDNA